MNYTLSCCVTMSPDEIQTAVQIAFNRCEAASCPLTQEQKEILLQTLGQTKVSLLPVETDSQNPLDELTPEELDAFLQFVKLQEEDELSWKAQLLNDWLNENDSGAVQFIRERYGLQWLNRLKSNHFDAYALKKDVLKLKVGDQIEVCNALWEWVQDDGPCSREWYACTILQVNETSSDNGLVTNCFIRFNNGAEFEIQGIYEWNRCYWRWMQR